MADRRFKPDQATHNRDFKPRHDPEVQALDAVRGAIRYRDWAALRELAAGRLPQGWPAKYTEYLGNMTVGALSFLRDGDRNTRQTDFNGFAEKPGKPAATAAQPDSPLRTGYHSVVDGIFADADRAVAAAADEPAALGAETTQRIPTGLEQTRVLSRAELVGAAVSHRYVGRGEEQTVRINMRPAGAPDTNDTGAIDDMINTVRITAVDGGPGEQTVRINDLPTAVIPKQYFGGQQ
jgi:hypothetical protein